MSRTLLLLVLLAGCRTTEPTPATDGPAPLQVTQGPPPSYFLTDNVDSNTSLRARR